MSCWYTRKEMALRCAILYPVQTLAFCVAGLIAAAVFGTLEGSYGLAGWQWLFIVLVGMNIDISAAYGFSNFFSSIARGFNYLRVITLALTAPPYIFAALSSLPTLGTRTRPRSEVFTLRGLLLLAALVMSFVWRLRIGARVTLRRFCTSAACTL